MIGGVGIKSPKCNFAMNAWLPHAKHFILSRVFVSALINRNYEGEVRHQKLELELKQTNKQEKRDR